MAIESLVAVLLILTIGYCMLLNSRLKRLKADEHSLKAVIGELITATEIAERAIGGLKQTVREVNEHLGNQLATAGQMSQQLKQQLAEGDYVVRRLTKIAIAARPSNATEPEAKTDLRTDMTADIKTDAPKVSAAKATAAAAQAFLDRKRSDGLAA
jgi:L-2-hydroxyglutarate oxidase LhgO